MTEAPRRLSRLGGSKTALSLLKTTPNVTVVRKKGSVAGKVDLLPAVPVVLKDKKRKNTSEVQGKLKKVHKARASFVPVDFRLTKAPSLAVMPTSRQTPVQLQLVEEADETPVEPKMDEDYHYPPLQLPFRAPHTRSPLLSALSPPLQRSLPPLSITNNSWLDFALDAPSLCLGPQPPRAQSLPLSGTLSDQQLMIGYNSSKEERDPPDPPLPLLESYLTPLPPMIRQNTAPAPVPRQGYIKQENGLARLLFRSGTLDEFQSSLMFLQLPTKLPITTPPLLKPTPKKLAQSRKQPGTPEGDEGSTLKQIPPGFLGNITLYKSGRMTFQLGGVTLNVDTGTRKTFCEELVAVSPEVGEAFPLGSISTHLVLGLDV